MKRLIASLSLTALLLPLFAACSGTSDSGDEVIEEGTGVEYHTQLQLGYIRDEVTSYGNYANGEEERSRPDPILLDFSSDELPESETYVIEIAGSVSFESSRLIEKLTAPVYAYLNPFSGEDVYYRGAADRDSLAGAPIHHLTVSTLLPRNICLEGVTNVRDIGGYASGLAEGAVIRQGLYYRGAKLKRITADGVSELLGHLGVLADIDLRDADPSRVPPVDGMFYYDIPIPSGTEATRFEEFADEYRQIFTLVSRADERPVYLHCSAGADRTGLVSFMLLAVLGASYDDIARDYLFTNFANEGERGLGALTEWWEKLDRLEGETTAEKAKTWMLSKGIPEETIEQLRTVFVEGYSSNS